MESLENWGFRDTSFAINENGNVTILGNRYELSGKELPRLLPWIRETLDIDPDINDRFEPRYPPEIPEPVDNADFVGSISDFLAPEQIERDADSRIRHGHGHTQEEMFAIKYGNLGRVPDLVVYPETEEQVAMLVDAAKRTNVVLIPFGGGTNVTDALRCRENESRMIVSVDMRRLSRIVWIDKENMIASIQAGAVGRHLMQQLAEYGVTMGHEPDSVEFSTLGGWIATNASGMKKNKYGNIEDIVVDIAVATADGRLERLNLAPRESVGSDMRRLIFGSEGTLGIVTSATVKLFPLPEAQEYGSVLFPSYEEGFAFMQELVRTSRPPASCRLVDNLQFQFGLALKPAASGTAALKGRIEKFFVTKIKGFQPYKMVALTLVFEGTRADVEQQKRDVYRIAARHGGMKAGSENGRRGYQLTYSIAYIRDFLMNYYIIAESFETSCAWSDALAVCDNVKRVLTEEYKKRGLPGKPFITSRITQLYQTGVAIYFYFGFYFKGVEAPSQVYLELENIARAEILRSGGSLSHHHGVGKIREGFLSEIMSETSLKWKKAVKASLDPDNIFGAGNQNLG
ncbi:MAG TPA: FAD-binding oxidoreductase [Pyrinomonadaceae bacterium]|nr:FAD-binding oxidoreductase [Pyrinomonadaceae bacterium]HMP64279.1 FAD-binding oxidoreductase [Pyrinomonadaceae bacterium]